MLPTVLAGPGRGEEDEQGQGQGRLAPHLDWRAVRGQTCCPAQAGVRPLQLLPPTDPAMCRPPPAGLREQSHFSVRR